MRNFFYILIYSTFGFLYSQNSNLAAPSWVSQRPISSSRFIGIGVAEKTPGSNYIMEAKKNALYDLASEIKVNISSNSMLYSYQNNNQFNQTYNSLIKLSNTENIEGYQQAGTYENEKHYWVYYYLEKEEYFKRKEQKKQQTLQSASQMLMNAEKEFKSGSYTNALFLRLKAFGTLIPYLNEEIKLNPNEAGGVSNILHLSQLIQTQLDGIQINGLPSAPDFIPLQKNYQPLELKISYSMPMNFSQLPFTFEYNEEEMMIKNDVEEAVENSLKINIEKIMKTSGNLFLTVTPELDIMTQRDSVARAGSMLAKQIIALPKKQIILRLRPLNVFFDIQFKNFSKKINPSDAYNADYTFKDYFKGLPILEVTDLKTADYIISIQTDTRLSADHSYLFSSTQNYLTELVGEIVLKDGFQKEIYRHPLTEIFGYDKDKNTAGLKSYQSRKGKTALKVAAFHIQRKMMDY
jgi:hypothetical protein